MNWKSQYEIQTERIERLESEMWRVSDLITELNREGCVRIGPVTLDELYDRYERLTELIERGTARVRVLTEMDEELWSAVIGIYEPR